MIDFSNINYLKSGTPRQQKAFQELQKLNIFELLKNYTPILTGTIPINIDIPESDLDIICNVTHHYSFASLLTELFSTHPNFKLYTTNADSIKTTICCFNTNHFKIEIFGQNKPTKSQQAYRHMIIEHHILNTKGPEFRANIISLKKKGLKTEPAFAKLLGLSGDPYAALLNITI